MLRIAVALLVIILCLLGIYGAKSKGVWLALGFTLPLQALTGFLHLPRRHAIVGGAAFLLGIAVILFVASAGMVRELAPFTASASALFDAAMLNGTDAVRDAIASGSIPFSFNERLQLWMNAREIIAANPVFGAGIGWQEIWDTTTYAAVPYHLMHNGYVEIAVRYGISGLVFFAALWAIFAWWILRAWQKKLIHPDAAKTWGIATLFFALTLLTNSNNRLAIGESFILISAAFAFYAYNLLQPKIDT